MRWRRSFHAPRQLEPDEQLWLTFGGVDYFATVSLNGVPLGDHEGYFEPLEFDITHLVANHNEVAVDVECPAESDLTNRRMIRGSLESRHPGFVAGIWREVAIEVRSVASLRDVRVKAHLVGGSGRITATGRVVGRPDTTVTVELASGEAWLDRAKFELLADGTSFTLQGELPNVDLWWPRGMGTPRLYPVRVELHGAARTLDAVYRSVGFRETNFDPEMSWAEVNQRRIPVRIHELDCAADPLLTRPAAVEPELLAAEPPGTLAVFRVPGWAVASEWYDWSDSHGTPLIQEFPCEAAGVVDNRRMTTAVHQANVIAGQLAHHPSVFLWSWRADRR